MPKYKFALADVYEVETDDIDKAYDLFIDFVDSQLYLSKFPQITEYELQEIIHLDKDYLN